MGFFYTYPFCVFSKRIGFRSFVEKMERFREIENDCEKRFSESGPFFLLTLGQLPFLLFENDEEFIEGNNILAISSAVSDVQILSYALMNNHLHSVVEGDKTKVESMAERMKNALRQYIIRKSKPRDYSLEIRIDPLNTLSSFRNATIYVDRNAYVARKDSTPTGYQWGSGNLMFNGTLWLRNTGVPFLELTYRERRKLAHAREPSLPESYRCCHGMILNTSFVNYKRTESLFNSANQYFSMLLRHAESDLEIAKQIGESILLPNEDVFLIVSGWYPGQKLYSLTLQQRIDAAKKMKRLLSSNNKQIAQVLRLPLNQLEELFPAPK